MLMRAHISLDSFHGYVIMSSIVYNPKTTQDVLKVLPYINSGQIGKNQIKDDVHNHVVMV